MTVCAAWAEILRGIPPAAAIDTGVYGGRAVVVPVCPIGAPVKLALTASANTLAVLPDPWLPSGVSFHMFGRLEALEVRLLDILERDVVLHVQEGIPRASLRTKWRQRRGAVIRLGDVRLH